MSQALSDLLSLLELESLGVNHLRGASEDLGFRALFGGQVLGQSIKAAAMTLDGPFQPHSMHGYFLRPGTVKEPVDYEVDCVRDGHSFSVRRVTASQSGRAIFTMTSSFQVPEEGLDHQDDMPEVKGPEGIKSQLELTRMFKDFFPEKQRAIYTADKPIEIRPVDPVNVFAPKACEPVKYAWFRATGKLPDDPLIHQSILTYASDFNLLTAALQPHGVSVIQKDMRVASLDHAIWFHRPFRADEWMLYAIDSPSASGGRGLCRGKIYNQQGVLIASVTQEGLIRKINV